MKKFNLIKLKKIKGFFKKFPRILGENAFLTILGVSLFSLILGILIFYQYSILAQKEKLEDIGKSFKFKEKTHQAILKTLEEREEIFEMIDLKQYPDPFRTKKESEKKLSEERIQELLSRPLVQELLKASNLYEFYITRGEELFTIEERSQIWQELDLGQSEEYQGSYSQNIKLLIELKIELTGE